MTQGVRPQLVEGYFVTQIVLGHPGAAEDLTMAKNTGLDPQMWQVNTGHN